MTDDPALQTKRALRGADRSTSRAEIIKRLFKLLSRQITLLEDAMDKKPSDAEVAVLDRLVGTLGKLIVIETRNKRPSRARQSKEMENVRNKLVERIEQLKRS